MTLYEIYRDKKAFLRIHGKNRDWIEGYIAGLGLFGVEIREVKE